MRKPILSERFGTTVVRLQLPVRSPSPFIVPWTWRAPARTAATALATAHPVSSCVWMAMVASSRKWLATTATISSTSNGSEPPLVSQRTRWLAPFSTAASSTRRLNSGLRLKPSKKCSASNSTRSPFPARNSTLSPTIASPSASVVPSASVTW